MTTPRIKVRLIYVSRDTRELDWLDKAQEVHSIGMELIDANTRDGGKGTIYFYSVDPAVCSFIAGTKIGEEFDVALMPAKKPSETMIKDHEDAWKWCREHGASYNTIENAGTLTGVYLNAECIGVGDTLVEAVRDAILWVEAKEHA